MAKLSPGTNRVAGSKSKAGAARNKPAAAKPAELKPAELKPAKTAAKPRSTASVRLFAGAAAHRVYHPGPPIDGEAALAAALAALRAIDPQTIDHLLTIGGAPPLRLRPPGFEGLVSIVMGQQLSVASAGAIDARLRARFTPLTAASLAHASDDELRACGLSAAKIRTVRGLSAAVASGALDLEGLADAAPEAAHAALVALPGIGPWTADIFLLFCLGHPDAWPAGDLALQEATRHALKLEARPDAPALEAIAERWRPHRGVAARLLWAYYRVLKQGRDGVIGTP